MPVVDAHQHFWDPARAEYPWLTKELERIRRRFDPADLKPELERCGVDRTVLVQTRSSLEETREFLEIADSTSFVAGVVGWADLTDPNLPATLADLRKSRGGSKLVGIRHQVHDEHDAEWLQRAEVWRGLRHVADVGLTFDLVLRPRELPAAVATVRALPQVRFVVDHIAKPEIRTGRFDGWSECIARLADCPNSWCKLSGMVTEADWRHWTARDLAPYVSHIRRCFGDNRLMFGSDWPVCLLAASYEQVVNTLREVVHDAGDEARVAIFGGSAIQCYGLN
jgi:L-fucono-1,5-lactonase